MKMSFRGPAVFLCSLLVCACSGASPSESPGGPSNTTQPAASGATLASAPAGQTPAAGGPSGPTGISETPGPAGSGEEGVWSVGGTVTGLQGSGLILYDLGQQLPIDQDGSFTFPQPLPDGAIYTVWVVTQPKAPDQACSVSNGYGTIFGGDVTDVTVDCVAVTTSLYLDPSFGAGGKVMTGMTAAHGEGLALADDGKIILAGSAAGDGSGDFAVARYNADGSLDTTFGGGVVTTDLSQGVDEAFDVAVGSDHKVVAVGVANERSGDDFGIVRYNEDGSLDTTFGNGGIVTTDFFGGVDRAQAVVLAGDTIIVAGHAANGLDSDFALARYTSDGTLDATFGNGGLVTTDIAGQADFGQAVALSPDGSTIVVAGRVARDGGASPDFGVVRYMLDGSLDSSFGNGGIVRTDFPTGSDDAANGVVVLSDGSVIAAGYTIGGKGFDFALAKYGVDGQPDASFGDAGLATADFLSGQDYGQAVAIGPSDTIVVAGNTQGAAYDMAIARFTAGGILDPTFGAAGLVTVDFHGSGETAEDVAVQTADGKIVAGGYAQNGSDTELAIVRLSP